MEYQGIMIWYHTNQTMQIQLVKHVIKTGNTI